jgi:hypothetical protein
MVDVACVGLRNDPPIIIDFESIPQFGFWNFAVRNDASFQAFDDCCFLDSLGGD